MGSGLRVIKVFPSMKFYLLINSNLLISTVFVSLSLAGYEIIYAYEYKKRPKLVDIFVLISKKIILSGAEHQNIL